MPPQDTNSTRFKHTSLVDGWDWDNISRWLHGAPKQFNLKVATIRSFSVAQRITSKAVKAASKIRPRDTGAI
jgi:hypothetical protein